MKKKPLKNLLKSTIIFNTKSKQTYTLKLESYKELQSIMTKFHYNFQSMKIYKL